MAIPNKVKIGAVTYEVILAEKPILKGNNKAMGCIDFDNSTIEVDISTQSPQMAQQTFLHELVHGMIQDRQINLKDDEEAVVNQLANAIHQVIVDNPDIFKL